MSVSEIIITESREAKFLSDLKNKANEKKNNDQQTKILKTFQWLLKYPKLWTIVGGDVALTFFKYWLGHTRHSSFNLGCEMWLSALESSTNNLPKLGFEMHEIRWLQDMSFFNPNSSDQIIKIHRLPPNLYGEFITSTSIPANQLVKRKLNDQEEILTTQKVVLFLHGGGYCTGGCDAYRKQISIVSKLTKLTHYVLEYPLAPENSFPVPLEHTYQAYKQLFKIFKNDLYMSGDSAGAGLIISILLKLQEENETKEKIIIKNNNDEMVDFPKKAVLVSPWVDLSWESSAFENGNSGIAFEFVRNYISNSENINLQNPLISPLYGDFSKFQNKTEFLCFSGIEPIAKDIEKFVEKMENEKVKIIWETCDHLPHTYPLLCLGVHDTAENAICKIGEFFEDVLK